MEKPRQGIWPESENIMLIPIVFTVPSKYMADHRKFSKTQVRIIRNQVKFLGWDQISLGPARFFGHRREFFQGRQIELSQIFWLKL